MCTAGRLVLAPDELFLARVLHLCSPPRLGNPGVAGKDWAGASDTYQNGALSPIATGKQIHKPCTYKYRPLASSSSGRVVDSLLSYSTNQCCLRLRKTSQDQSELPQSAR